MSITPSWTAALVFGAVLALAPVAAHGIDGAPSWKPHEHAYGPNLDYLGHLGCDHILAYDHHGNPAIAVYDTDYKELRYCRRVPASAGAVGSWTPATPSSSTRPWPSTATSAPPSPTTT